MTAPTPSVPDRLNSALTDSYVLERELGAGGMATVYLATDLRHHRKVAIKVLHPDLAAALGADRFLQEIRTTANLQHPHILGLIDSGQVRVRATDTDDGGQWLYYVMPFVEGESLRDRLNRERQLPVEDAVRLAREVASALDFAHRKGVVHRDIKPENILLQDGQALVADFGIALAVQSAGGARMTQTGLSLGTPHYMAPEQAMGDKTIDARADIYALGCVLYEMLSGEPPYTGATSQAIVARLLTEEPRSIVALRKSVPVHVEAATLMALQKLPADRFATIAEFGEALRNPSATHLRTGVVASSQFSRAWRTRAFVAVGVAAVSVAAAAWALSTRNSGAVAPAMSRMLVAMPDSANWYGRSLAGVALSADGSHLAFVGVALGDADPVIMVKRRDRIQPWVIRGSKGVLVHALSSDGSRVAFTTLDQDGTVKVAPTDGDGEPVTLQSGDIDVVGIAFDDEGYVYFVQPDSGIMRIRADGGAQREVVVPRASISNATLIAWPNTLPGNRGVLFTIMRNTSDVPEFDIGIWDNKTHTARSLMRGLQAQYVEPGFLVIALDDGSLKAAPFDLPTLAITGELVSLEDKVQVGIFGSTLLTTARDGTLLYRRAGGVGEEDNILVRFNGKGELSQVDTSWTKDFSVFDLSADGKLLAITIRERAVRQIWIRDFDRGTTSKLTLDKTEATSPVWMSDGRTVAYVSARDSQHTVYAKPADGSSEARSLFKWNRRIENTSFSADGKWMIMQVRPDQQSDLYAVMLGSDTLPRPLVTTKASETDPALSPDGKWLAYTSNESGRNEVYVRPFPEVERARWPVSTQGGSRPHWTRNGRELVFLAAGTMMSSAVTPGSTFTFDEPRRLFSGRPTSRWDVSDDGEAYVFIDERDIPRNRIETVLLQNWQQFVKATLSKKTGGD